MRTMHGRAMATNKNKPEKRKCCCGCGASFAPHASWQRFIDDEHRNAYHSEERRLGVELVRKSKSKRH